jgi:AAA domain
VDWELRKDGTGHKTMSLFKKATRVQIPLKLGIEGGPGTGKTFSALRLATGLAAGGRIAMIDSENESASLYAEQFDFDVVNIHPPFEDSKFVTALKAAAEEKYKVAILDSLSHGWEGVLDWKTTLDKKGGNSYTNWSFAGQKFKSIIDTVVHLPIHVIACFRNKMGYVLETDLRGKQVPRKIGLEPICRDGVEYEFSTVFSCESDHHCVVTKDRTTLFIDRRFQITEETGTQLLEWLNSAPQPEPKPTAQQELARAVTDVDPELLSAFLITCKMSPDGSVLSVSDKHAQQVLQFPQRFRESIEKFRQEAASNGVAEPVTTQGVAPDGSSLC